jgi:hypothetical protein
MFKENKWNSPGCYEVSSLLLMNKKTLDDENSLNLTANSSNMTYKLSDLSVSSSEEYFLYNKKNLLKFFHRLMFEKES